MEEGKQKHPYTCYSKEELNTLGNRLEHAKQLLGKSSIWEDRDGLIDEIPVMKDPAKTAKGTKPKYNKNNKIHIPANSSCPEHLNPKF